jgi:TPR repeat protein
MKKFLNQIFGFKKNQIQNDYSNLFNQIILGDKDALRIIFEDASNGIPKAQSLLGNVHFGGHGVSVDYSKAAYWWKLASENGLVEAQVSLANCYRDGWGVEKNIVTAVDLYKTAAKQNDTFSMLNLASIFEKGEGNITADPKQSFEWLKLAADNGEINAEHSLAVCYRFGIGTEVDLAKSFSLADKTAAKGFSESQRLLADCYLHGIGVEKNFVNAIDWYIKSAQQKNIEAILSLVKLYEEMSETDSSFKADAIHWLTLGSDLGDLRCAEQLTKYM